MYQPTMYNLFNSVYSVSSYFSRGFLYSPKNIRLAETLCRTYKWFDAWIKCLILWFSCFSRSSNWMEIEEGNRKKFWRYNILRRFFLNLPFFPLNRVEANSLNDKYYFNPCMYPFFLVCNVLVCYVINSVFSFRLSMKLTLWAN